MNRAIAFCTLLLSGIFLSSCTKDQETDQEPVRFTKHVDVMGIDLYATELTRDEKILHAANVIAEYLDSDEDGLANNQDVLDCLVEDDAALFMTRSAQEFDRLEDKWIPEHGIGQGLWDEGTHPGGAEEGVFDASLKEVLHLITWGYMAVYPEIFGAERGTNIAIAMDTARGGYFNGVPIKYPSGAWYTYYDETCEYQCQVFEYFYWALTSILGGQEFEGRLEQIDDEWRYNTRAKVQEGDPAVYYLMKHPRHDLPNQLPDGEYNAQTFTIEDYP